MLEKEWAGACKLEAIEKQMFDKFMHVTEISNICQDKEK